MKLKFGFKYVESIQEFCHLAKAVALVFGGEEQKDTTPDDFISAQLQLAAVFGG